MYQINTSTNISDCLKNTLPTLITLGQRCTRFLHACSALCKCANWLCRTCPPHHTVAGRSSVSLTQSPFAFPSNCRCGPPSPATCRAGPFHPVHACTAQQHPSSHTVRCARLVHLCPRTISKVRVNGLNLSL
jgi:hypothetical protein